MTTDSPEEDKKGDDIACTIDRLCCDLKPCGRLRNPLWRSLLWMVIAVTYVVAIALMVGLQPNTMDRLSHNQHFVFEIALALATGIFASLATFFLSVPDGENKGWLFSIPATLFGVHILWMLVKFAMEGMGIVPSDWLGHCWMDTIMMAGVPAGLVLFLIRKGATVRPRLLAFNAVLAVASFSWVGIRFICPFETVGKAYFVNFLPFIVVGLIVGAISKRLFRW